MTVYYIKKKRKYYALKGKFVKNPLNAWYFEEKKIAEAIKETLTKQSKLKVVSAELI